MFVLKVIIDLHHTPRRKFLCTFVYRQDDISALSSLNKQALYCLCYIQIDLFFFYMYTSSLYYCMVANVGVMTTTLFSSISSTLNSIVYVKTGVIPHLQLYMDTKVISVWPKYVQTVIVCLIRSCLFVNRQTFHWNKHITDIFK